MFSGVLHNSNIVYKLVKQKIYLSIKSKEADMKLKTNSRGLTVKTQHPKYILYIMCRKK